MCNLRVEVDPARFAPELARLGEHERDGLCVVSGGRVEVTPLGRVFVRNLAMVFDAYLPETPAERPRFSRTV
jgi:oxygen-independent coproporphyrinogen-3 oxidase